MEVDNHEGIQMRLWSAKQRGGEENESSENN